MFWPPNVCGGQQQGVGQIQAAPRHLQGAERVSREQGEERLEHEELAGRQQGRLDAGEPVWQAQGIVGGRRLGDPVLLRVVLVDDVGVGDHQRGVRRVQGRVRGAHPEPAGPLQLDVDEELHGAPGLVERRDDRRVLDRIRVLERAAQPLKLADRAEVAVLRPRRGGGQRGAHGDGAEEKAT